MAASILPFPPSGTSRSRSLRRGSSLDQLADQGYRIPDVLRGIHVLNLLELTGSQQHTSQLLGLHQSSVSRILRSLQSQLQLAVDPNLPLRFGHNPCLSHLRQAARAHRLEGGWLQLGADLLHRDLLQHLPGGLPLPASFHGIDQVAELVRHAVLDGALVSSLAWELPHDQAPRWQDLRLLDLGEMGLQLAAFGPMARAVLVPHLWAAPGLHAQLVSRGLPHRVAPATVRGRRAWLRYARLEGLALPLCPALLPPGWLEREGLIVQSRQRPLRQRLWLMLSESLPHCLQERCGRRLQRRCAWLAWRSSAPALLQSSSVVEQTGPA